jgi:hypothetical protein
LSAGFQKFAHNGVDVFYDSQKIARKVTVDSIDLDVIFALFNESNYNVVKMLYFAPEFEMICNRIFDAAKELFNNKEFTTAAYTAARLFEQFTTLWNYYLDHQRHLLGTKLWQHVCRMTWKWEKSNNATVHKGTPYFFLGANQLMQGNLDNAFLFIHNAMEEDIRYSSQIGDPSFYKTMPAYLFSSLIADNPKNYLYPYAQEAKRKLDSFIQTHNALLSAGFSYSDFDSKFLKNQDLEETKFFFVYNLFAMINHDVIDTIELRKNEFSKLRNLDVIFNLCLIIDEVMKKKTNQKYISESVIQICDNNFGEKDAYNIFKSLNFENDFENAVKKCLSLSYSYGTKSVSKEVLLLILAWGLRNFGGHKIEAKQLFVDEYQNLVEKLMSGLSLTLEKLY